MESSLRRKRKGGVKSSSSSSSSAESPDDVTPASRRKKTCRESKSAAPEKSKPAASTATPERGIVMTAPASGSGVLPDSPCRGLKRKLGCIEPATRIGRKKKLESEYDLGDEIGQGKFGSVRICRSKASGEACACKVLPKNGEETVHREVEIMQHLSGHPGIVTLRSVFEDADKFYLVMELCSGGRLVDEMVREGRYSERKAANVIRELMSVVKYCHEMGVVHRDIKPENILLTKSGKIKLADFGLAARVTNGQRLSGIAGSPAYVAPEVLLGSYSEKVDVWGAGVLLHALLMGVLPFQGGSLEAVFEAIKTVELDFNSGEWESVSKLGRNLIGQMLNRDVCKRMTADEVLGHPWILFYTETPSKNIITNQVTNGSLAPRIQWARIRSDYESLSSGTWSNKSEQEDECGFVDALAAAISRVSISEPKRSRLCSPVAVPIQQECSSNLKANLCTAF